MKAAELMGLGEGPTPLDGIVQGTAGSELKKILDGNASLHETASYLFSDHRGILAMDESTGTCNRRFAENSIPQTEPFRQAYRELIITTPRMSQFISGVILFDETIHERNSANEQLVEIVQRSEIVPGIKVDTGAKPLALHPEETITEGLDGLRERLQGYRKLGARFAKWRAVIKIDLGLPTRACVEANAQALARYAALCQDEGLVPIVEAEVLMLGDHSFEQCGNSTEYVLHTVFEALFLNRVSLSGMVLKPNMVTPGSMSLDTPTNAEVADRTVETLLRTVPAAVPGIAFLSGGQTGALASERLNAMNERFSALPWGLGFSFARAIQQPALSIWGGNISNIGKAQDAILHRAQCNWSARQGEYSSDLELS